MATFNPVQGADYQLSGSGVASTDTSIGLKSLKLPDESTNITMSDFGDIGYGTLEPGTIREENISFAGITQNADGSATLTGVTRGLKFVSDYTADSSFRKAHAGGTSFRITNNVQFYAKFPNLDNDESITGQYTFDTGNFPKMSDTTTNPSNDAHLATKGYVDGVITSGTINTDKIIVAGDAGETIAAGELVYMDTVTNNEWMLCDANTAASVDNVQIGKAQGAGTDGNGISGGVLVYGKDETSTSLTVGAPYYASDTAGAIASSAGSTEVVLGFGDQDGNLFFNPRYAQQITEDEQDALAGNGGTPASGNTYVTQQGYQEGSETYGADAGGDDTYVIALSPVLAAYTDGQRITFEPATVNTGACTLDAGPGAKAIKKFGDAGVQDLDDGDIQAGQSVTVVYDSGNDYFELLGAPMISKADSATLTGGVSSDASQLHEHAFAFGATSRNMTAATGTQNIAHGMSVTPKRIKITATYASTNGSSNNSFGVFDGTSYATVYVQDNSGQTAASSTAQVVFLRQSSGNQQVATAAIDGTNITLSWTKTGSPTGLAQILWEAWA